MAKKIFAFDMGKASIGYCVREDNDIKEVNSILIDKEHADMSSLTSRRRIRKNINAHKAREEYLCKIWSDCGLVPLDTGDAKFKKEYGKPNDLTIYTSCLLRIALLQNMKLEEWQIYKALNNAIQRRGYDSNLPWKTAQTDDDKKSLELINKYTQDNGKELINNDDYKYPCYYDAIRLNLWEESRPHEFINCVSEIKVRTTLYTAPRTLIEKELKQLWINAQRQLPALNKYKVEEFLYGEYEEAYGSYRNPDYKRYMGTDYDRQGVLGQKIPRFNNRIIAKCKLLPKRNVCKADTIENVSFVLLMKLKNLRLTDNAGSKILLSPDEIRTIYENWLSKMHNKDDKLDTTITKKEIEAVINKVISDKIEPMKVNISGRSSFCRRACQVMSKFILSGELYPNDMDISEFVDPVACKNGITEEEIRSMLSKIGNWNNLYIPDNRSENAENSSEVRTKTDIMIGNITNPIVRNRLQIFRDLLLSLYKDYGKPDEVIFEFIRDGADNSLSGKKKAQATEAENKKHEKENALIIRELKEQDAYSPKNFEKFKLLKMQGGRCVYSGLSIGISDSKEEAVQNFSVYSGLPIGISDLDICEIDHIYPRTMGGNDALYNKVLCFSEENKEKAGRTPYEWLSTDKEKWANYVKRLNDIKQNLGKKKFELLTNPPEDCAKLIESYNGLAETSYIAKIAQQIAAFVFGWGLQVEGEKRHIFVNNGASTYAIRKRYGLNSLLGDDLKKNRANDKHHALDAICISYSRDFKYDKNSGKDIIEGFTREQVKKVLDEIIPYPYTHKKPLKSNLRPDETIYGLRKYGEKSYITRRVPLEKIEPNNKKIEPIIDEVIKNDLLEKLSQNTGSKEWQEMLQNYTHPTKQTKVKKVMIVVSEGNIETDSNGRERLGDFCDFGTKGTKHQFKHSKGHKGQILYFNERGTVKVMPVYANIKTTEVKDRLKQMGYKLYNGGEMFYSGCLIKTDKPFEATVETGKNVSVRQSVPEGIYKIKTIETEDGTTYLENASGIKIRTNAKTMVMSNMVMLKN